MSAPPPKIQYVWKFLKKHPDHIFIFQDKRAALTYDSNLKTIVYLIGNFDGMINGSPEAYVTVVAQKATEAMLN